jgi:PmbA protein
VEPLDPQDARELGRRIVEASDADETEVTIDLLSEGFVRFAEIGPTQNADRRAISVAIRTRFREGGGFSEARAVAGSPEEGDWRAALARALELARISPPNEEACPLEGAVEVPATRGDRATIAHGFTEKAAWIRRALAACAERRLAPAGLIRTFGISRTIVNSEGRAVYGEFSRGQFALTATGAEGSGMASVSVPHVEDLDAEGVIERAVEKATRAQDPQPLEAGEYCVILEPAAVSSILLFAGYCGFGAREVEEKSSFLCGRIGERTFAPELTIRDDVLDPAAPGLPFDGEGNLRQRVVLVDRGTPLGPVTDRIHARKGGVPCTGHATPQPNVQGPIAENLVVECGSRSIEELIAGVERGLLITQFHYTNMIEPRDLTLTGMTRNGTFLIEKGEVKHAVNNLRFTHSLARALHDVSGIGDRAVAASALFDGEIVTPALRIEGFRFTSRSDC